MAFDLVDFVNHKEAKKLIKSTNNRKKIAEDVFEAIHTLMHQIRSEQYHVVRDSPYELTHMEGKMLGFFYRTPGATLSDLVAKTGRDKGQLARTIKHLKEQGLLTAEPDAADRRIHLLSLTEAGKRVHESLIDQLQHLSELAVKDMPAADCEQLLTLLNQIRTNLHNTTNT